MELRKILKSSKNNFLINYIIKAVVIDSLNFLKKIRGKLTIIKLQTNAKQICFYMCKFLVFGK